LSYAFCGVFVFLILRALGELVLHRPSSGSFVSYAREFLGEKAAFVGRLDVLAEWAFTAIVDSTAIATYFHYWTSFGSFPQWLIALLALAAVGEHKPSRLPCSGSSSSGLRHQVLRDDISGSQAPSSCRPLRDSGAVNRL